MFATKSYLDRVDDEGFTPIINQKKLEKDNSKSCSMSESYYTRGDELAVEDLLVDEEDIELKIKQYACLEAYGKKLFQDYGRNY